MLFAAAMRSQSISVCQSPINNTVQGRQERFSQFGQTVLDPWRDFRIYLTCHQAEILQALQRLGEHFPGDIRHVFLEIPEAAYAVFLHGHHGQNRPFVSYLGENVTYRAKTFKIRHKLISLIIIICYPGVTIVPSGTVLQD